MRVWKEWGRIKPDPAIQIPCAASAIAWSSVIAPPAPQRDERAVPRSMHRRIVSPAGADG